MVTVATRGTAPPEAEENDGNGQQQPEPVGKVKWPVADDCIFDFETGPLPEDELRELFTPPDFAEFAENCDKRWKPETVQAKFAEYEAKAWPEFQGKAALSAATGRILVAGYYFPEEGRYVADDGGGDEEAIIRRFLKQVRAARKMKLQMIGANIINFDVPFAVQRAAILGIPLDGRHLASNQRYLSDVFVDVQERWRCGLSRGECKSSVAHLANVLRIGHKNVTAPDGTVICGANFWQWWERDRGAALTYLRNDLDLEFQIAERLGVIR